MNLFKKGQNIFDQIICDPPYGIRAGARESGAKEGALHKEDCEDVDEESIGEDEEEIQKVVIVGDPMKEGEDGEV